MVKMLQGCYVKTIEEYAAYAKQNLCMSMLYLKDTNDIEMFNLINGKKKVVNKKIK